MVVGDQRAEAPEGQGPCPDGAKVPQALTQGVLRMLEDHTLLAASQLVLWPRESAPNLGPLRNSDLWPWLLWLHGLITGL